MTVVSLYDILAKHQVDSASGSTAEEPSRLAKLAASMVAELRDEYRRIRNYEEVYGDFPEDLDDGTELELLRSIWRMFDRWAEEAEEVLARAKLLKAAGETIADLDGLEDDYWRSRARLSVTPEQIIHSKQQARRGEIIPVEVLRNELRARLHQ